MSAVVHLALALLFPLGVSAALQHSDLDLVNETPRGFIYYSCTQDPQPCSTSSLKDCWCKEIRPPPSSALQAGRLTVWFTSPSNVARLLNNSKVKHLTVIHCGHRGLKGAPPPPSDSFFVVQHLARLTVIKLPFHGKSVHPEQDRDWGSHLDTNRFNRDTNMDFPADSMGELADAAQVQDILLGRELGAVFHEQARLGIVNSSVLDCGAAAKGYTVKTHIESDGALPFPDLHLPKLPEASVIYVSFLYCSNQP